LDSSRKTEVLPQRLILHNRPIRGTDDDETESPTVLGAAGTLIPIGSKLKGDYAFDVGIVAVS
jgi:hypothetical protein